mmetsp:Transcript_3417/g.12402  ORF Transcript_3417/g.12402 Transcript_3417/m.12402 type:complete len:240 (-) Transcript_3417:281-1000(-)
MLTMTAAGRSPSVTPKYSITRPLSRPTVMASSLPRLATAVLRKLLARSSNSDESVSAKSRKCTLTGPPKMRGAMSCENGMTVGSELPATNVASASLSVRSPSYAARGSSPSKLRKSTTESSEASKPEATPASVTMPKAVSSLPLATFSNALAPSDVASAKKPTTATSPASMKACTASASSSGLVAGPLFLRIHCTISFSVRPPPYSVGLPPLKNLSVGKPCTPKRSPSERSAVASTLAR